VSEARFTALLPEAEAANDPAYLSELLTQIARAQGLQRRYADATASLDRAQSLIRAEMIVPRIRLLLERGRVFNDTLQTAAAKACFVVAWEIGQAHRGQPRVDNLAVDAIHMIAIVEPPADSVTWNLRAIDYSQASDDPHARRWIGTLKNNLAWAYSSLGRYAEAVEIFEWLWQFHLKENRPGRAQGSRWCMAKNIRLLGRIEDALAIQQEIYAQLVVENKVDIDGYCREEFGECLLALGRPDEARPHFAKAFEVLSKDPWFPPTEAARLERMRQLGRV